MILRSSVVARLAILGLLGSLLCLGSPTTPASERRRFDVPAERAQVALKIFAEQSGLEIVYSPEILNGIRTAAVRGELAPLEALQLMLKNTGLIALREANGVITVRRTEGSAGSRALAEPTRRRIATPVPHGRSPAPAGKTSAETPPSKSL